jgi:hypothetical protein
LASELDMSTVFMVQVWFCCEIDWKIIFVKRPR